MILDLTFFELITAGVCLVFAAFDIAIRRDVEAFCFVIVGVAMVIVVMVTR